MSLESINIALNLSYFEVCLFVSYFFNIVQNIACNIAGMRLPTYINMGCYIYYQPNWRFVHQVSLSGVP